MELQFKAEEEKTIHSIAKMLEEKGNSLLQGVIKSQPISGIVIKSKILHKDIQDAIFQLKHRKQSIEDSLADLHKNVTNAENQKTKMRKEYNRSSMELANLEKICKVEIDEIDLMKERSQMITCDAEGYQVEVLAPLESEVAKTNFIFRAT